MIVRILLGVIAALTVSIGGLYFTYNLTLNKLQKVSVGLSICRSNTEELNKTLSKLEENRKEVEALYKTQTETTRKINTNYNKKISKLNSLYRAGVKVNRDCANNTQLNTIAINNKPSVRVYLDTVIPVKVLETLGGSNEVSINSVTATDVNRVQ